MTQKPLIERLGYSANAKAVIINCDDVGVSLAANIACEQAMRAGIATSGTLMVVCPWARDAVRRFHDLDMGVHLTLTAEYDAYRWRSLTGAPSLHDDEGYLPRKIVEVMARAEIDDVRREFRAQIEQALAWGVDVTHLDNHMGVAHVDPRFTEIAVELAAEYRLPLRTLSDSMAALVPFDIRPRVAAAGVVRPDDFVAEWGRVTAEVLRERLPTLRAGVTEFNVHPVADGPELGAYDPRERHIRVSDHRDVMDKDLARDLDDAGIIRISYRPLRDLQRGAHA